MHIDILIDASGSMGFMKGSEDENKYLIDDSHTRTDLVKSILINCLIPSLDFTDTISVECFLNKKKLNSAGNPIIKNKQYIEYPHLVTHFSGKYTNAGLVNSIQKIDNPEPGGTPLRWSLLYRVNKSSSSNHHIIVFSDGEGYWESKVDEDWPNVILQLIKSKEKNITVHFVGIAQSEETQKRCKYICSQTNGTYTNLASMNYHVSQLNSLLFNLKSNMTSNAINANINASTNKSENTIDEKVIAMQALHDDISNKSIQIDLESQVNRNTKSLELITNQLDNIVRLLTSKDEIFNDVAIEENTELNLKIGRLAEEFLYHELSKNGWDIIWLNKEEEKFLPYHFEVKVNNDIYYYECKGTISDMNEFQLTKNEWVFYLKNRERYRLCFVNNVKTKPSYILIMDLCEEMINGKLIPCSERNVKLKAQRIIFTYVP